MKKTKHLLVLLLAFILPALCLSVLFISKGIYPFGQASNMHSDLQIQYHDFFCYLKDIMSGESGIDYSFSKSLGGSTVALIGYYLLSPVNILLLLFKKSQIQLFSYISTMIKLGLCGMFFYTFASKRFKIPHGFCLMLSLAFAFTQYGAGQCTNIMWLDGVYMLPLMMLGIYRFVKEGKRTLFYVTTALSIVFCWYIGYMNCIFAVLYYIFETALHTERFDLKAQFKKLVHFLVIELLSVLLSCAVFLPVLLGQSGGRTVAEGVLKFGTNGNLLDFLNGFLIGSPYPSWQITLFCSVAVLIFFFAFWFSKASAKNKLAAGGLIGFMVLSMFFKPIENIWCGFRTEDSYMYRFLFLALAAVIVVAAMQLEQMCQDGAFCIRSKALLYGSGTYITILLVCDWVNTLDAKKLYFNIFLILTYTVLLYLLSGKIHFSRAKLQHFARVLSVACIALIFFVEIIQNARFVTADRYCYNASVNSEYTTAQQKLTEQLLPAEDQFYRIEQTLNRSGSNDVHYANESLAYGYAGIQTYTSCYDGAVSDILIHAGYTTSEFPSFYQQPILAMDSFLGVKYLLSQYTYAGFEKTELSGAGKDVYQNPYALSLGFAADESVVGTLEYDDPFTYVNALYSAVLGENTELYTVVESQRSVQDDGSIVFRLPAAENGENKILYLACSNRYFSTTLTVNEQNSTTYAPDRWGQYDNVVYIGTMAENNEITLTDCTLSAQELDLTFCYLDLNELERTTQILQNNAVDISHIEDGNVVAEYTASQDGYILFTIPYEEAWSVTVNGEKIRTLSGADSFICLPVTQGENHIEMQYSTKGKFVGVALSLISIVIFLLMQKKKGTKNA